MSASNQGFFIACLTLLLGLLGTVVRAQPLTFSIAPEIPAPQVTYEQVLENAESKVLKTRISYQKIENTPDRQAVWQRMTDYLSLKTGIEMSLVVPDGQLEFERSLAMGKFDMVYASPLQFLSAHQTQGYQAIAKRKAQSLRGIIVVLDQDKARTLRDIETSALGFSSLLNYANSVITRVSLNKLNIHPPLKLYPSTQSLLSALEQGAIRSAGLAQHELASLAPDHISKLRVLWETPGFSPYAIAVHPRIPFYSVNKLQRALASMSRRDEFTELLMQLQAINGFEIARNNDWVDAEKIQLETLNQHLNLLDP